MTKSTCQLFIDKTNKKEVAAPLGTGILFTHNDNFYLISCAHVLIDATNNGPYFFSSPDMVSTIGGKYVYSDANRLRGRNNDKFDIAIVKLSDESKQHFLSNNYIFLTENQILTGYNQSSKDYALCIGYPSSRTKVNSQSRGVIMSGLKYVSKFLKVDLKRFGFNENFHLFIKYAINNFINDSIGHKHRGPDPHGLSGGGVWAIVSIPNKPPIVQLVGLLTEYRKEHSLIVATKIDLIMDTIKLTFDPTIKNFGTQVDAY